MLTSRVEALQPVQQELHEAKVPSMYMSPSDLSETASEWQQAARSHGVENARALSNALDAALNSQLSATAENSQAQSQLSEVTEYERDRATRKVTDIQAVRKNQDNLIHRLQKRLLLVTRERDSYRQQLDCYEKELTVTGLTGEGAAGGALLATRVQQLEKSLQQYRDLLAAQDTQADTKDCHERELTVTGLTREGALLVTRIQQLEKSLQQYRDLLAAQDTQADTKDCYERELTVTGLTGEGALLATHVQQLEKSRQQYRDLLAAQDTQADTKALETLRAEVLHLVDNPNAQAQKQIQADLEAAQEEV
ncbi:Mitotic spindle assembly checkpoint protein MAD1, partial [Operophtera brumata]